jgi:hypothetical protein
LYPAVVRILVDYRPALRERTGVGEYIHQLARAYTAAYREEHPALHEFLERSACTNRSRAEPALE